MQEVENRSQVWSIKDLRYEPLNIYCPVCEHTGVTRREYRTSGSTHSNACYLGCTLCMPCIPWLTHKSNTRNAYHYCSYCGLRLTKWENDSVNHGYRLRLSPVLVRANQEPPMVYDNAGTAIALRAINASQGTVPSPLGAPPYPPVTETVPDTLLPNLLQVQIPNKHFTGHWTIQNTCPQLTSLGIQVMSVPAFDAKTNPDHPNVKITISDQEIGRITFSPAGLRFFVVEITTSYPASNSEGVSREPRTIRLHVAEQGSWDEQPIIFASSQGFVEWEKKTLYSNLLVLRDVYGRIVADSSGYKRSEGHFRGEFLRFAEGLSPEVVHEIVTTWVAYRIGYPRACRHEAEKQRRNQMYD